MKKYFIAVLFAALLIQTGCGQSQPSTTATEVLVEEAAITAASVENTAAAAEETAATEAPVAETAAESSGDIRDGYVFYNNDTPVYLGDEMTNVLAALGTETEYYEAPSCAFDGDAKIYVYNGFETATYIKDAADTDKLYSITFYDDSVTTAEGVYIGQSYTDMVAVYGEDYEEIPGSYLYTKDGAVLSFTVEDDVITVITYYIEDIYG